MADFFSADEHLAFASEHALVDAKNGTSVLYGARARVPVPGLCTDASAGVVKIRKQGNRLYASTPPVRSEVCIRHADSTVCLTPDRIVAEVMQLFFRGHSMYSEHCECVPHVYTQRRVHLNAPCRKGTASCTVPRRASFCSAEIAAEVGCASLAALCGGLSVHSILLSSGDFKLDLDMWTTTHKVSDVNSLLWYLLVHPNGVDLDDSFIQHDGLHACVERLREQRVVLLLTNCNGAPRVFVDTMRLRNVAAVDKYRIS